MLVLGAARFEEMVYLLAAAQFVMVDVEDLAS